MPSDEEEEEWEEAERKIPLLKLHFFFKFVLFSIAVLFCIINLNFEIYLINFVFAFDKTRNRFFSNFFPYTTHFFAFVKNKVFLENKKKYIIYFFEHLFFILPNKIYILFLYEHK